jgi:hypothetical protein
MTKAELVRTNAELLRERTRLRNQVLCIPRWVRWVCAVLKGRGEYYVR